MFKFLIGFICGGLALAYYPNYIDDIKVVTNNVAKLVADATEEPSVVDKATSLIK